MKILMIEFARVGLLITMLMFSVQANDRAKRIVRERRLPRDQKSSPMSDRTNGEETLLNKRVTRTTPGDSLSVGEPIRAIPGTLSAGYSW